MFQFSIGVVVPPATPSRSSTLVPSIEPYSVLAKSTSFTSKPDVCVPTETSTGETLNQPSRLSSTTQ